MKCPFCGRDVASDAKICYCGKDIQQYNNRPRRSRSIGPAYRPTRSTPPNERRRSTYNDDEDLRELEDAIARGVQKGLYGPTQDVPVGCQTVGILSIFGGFLALIWAADGFGMMLVALVGLVVGLGLVVALASLFD